MLKVASKIFEGVSLLKKIEIDLGNKQVFVVLLCLDIKLIPRKNRTTKFYLQLSRKCTGLYKILSTKEYCW